MSSDTHLQERWPISHTTQEQRERRNTCGRDTREWRNTSATQRSKVRICMLANKPCIEVDRCPIHEMGKG